MKELFKSFLIAVAIVVLFILAVITIALTMGSFATTPVIFQKAIGIVLVIGGMTWIVHVVRSEVD